MSDSVIRRGRDTYVADDNPDAAHAGANSLKAQSGHAKIYVYVPMPGVRGRTIESATLSCPAKAAQDAQTLTHTPVAEQWVPRKTTWNVQPSLRSGQAVATAVAALAADDRFELDVTAFVQTIADGTDNYGLCITTSSATANRFYAFNDPDHGAWVLRIDFTEAPEAPTDLWPNGTVVSEVPVLSFDFTDLGGDSTELASARVQVNTSASATGAWDSGHRDTVTPEFDLAAEGWPTNPVDGTTYYWRVFVKDGAGYESDPSDWASFTYDPKPSLIVDNPATGIAWDPTPTIAAHIDSGVIKAWRTRISRGGDKSKVLYDSGRVKGDGTASLAHTIPFRDDRGRRILKDDNNYWLNIRIWDRNDRQPTPGDPAWTQQWVYFHLDDDLTPPPPTALTATQTGDNPRVQLSWTRNTGFPEGWVIRRDGEIIARLDPDEVDVNGTTYTWSDPTATPFVPHTYHVKVIDGGKQSQKSNGVTITPKVVGTWLLSDTYGDVQFDGVSLDQLVMSEKRATYSPLNKPYDVDIVYALGGITGTYQGTFSTSRGRDVTAMRTTLFAMRSEPGQDVRFVYAEVNVRVELRAVSALPASTYDAAGRRHDVTFTVQQVNDFEDGA